MESQQQPTVRRPRIVKPKAVRSFVGPAASLVRRDSRFPPLVEAIDLSKLRSDRDCGVGSAPIRGETSFPTAVSLESLIPWKCDEDSAIQDQVMCEEEMRLRSSSFSPSTAPTSSSQFRNSYPLMNITAATLLAPPERPTNPMCRDSAFVFSAAVSCASEGRTWPSKSMETVENFDCGDAAAGSPPCVFN